MPSPSTNPRQAPRLRRSPPVVAIIGATGAVGRELLGVLERREFPLAELRLYASTRSAGTVLPFRGNDITVAALNDSTFAGVDLALFSAGAKTARQYAPAAVRHGETVVVDDLKTFQGAIISDPDSRAELVVPLIESGECLGVLDLHSPQAARFDEEDGRHGVSRSPGSPALRRSRDRNRPASGAIPRGHRDGRLRSNRVGCRRTNS